MAIDEVLGFNMVDIIVILFSFSYGVCAYDIKNIISKELIEPSFMSKML